MTTWVKWSVAELVHWGVLYGAFVVPLDGAMYALKFITWVTAAASLFILTEAFIAVQVKKPPEPRVRVWLTTVKAWVTLAALVWFGHIFSGIAWMVAMLMAYTHREEVRTRRAAEQVPQPPCKAGST